MTDDKSFITVDGKILSDLEDLVNYLENSNEETFNYHQDHFYQWIKDVFDPNLAEKIKGKNKEDMIDYIKSYLIIKEINKSLKEKLDKEYQKIINTPKDRRSYSSKELEIIKRRILINLEDLN